MQEACLEIILKQAGQSLLNMVELQHDTYCPVQISHSGEDLSGIVAATYNFLHAQVQFEGDAKKKTQSPQNVP